MGLIYSRDDSEKLMEALSKNLASGKEVLTKLKTGSEKIIQAVDGHKLSGTAYTAGKGLFMDLILPTIEKVTSACDILDQELQKYKTADLDVSSEGYLDEDNLQKQIETKRNMKESAERTSMFMKVIKTSVVAALSDVASEHWRELDQMSDNLQQDIDELQKKIEKLREFDAQTKGLFTSSLDEIKLAMQGVLVLNSTTVNPDGTYQLPVGLDKSWFTELKSKEQQKEMEEKAKKAAIKEINDLYEKNPMAAIEKIKNNDRLFGYVIGALDKFPEGLQNAALGIFIAQESWNKLPKDTAIKVLNSPKFASYVSGASVATQAVVYGGLIKLSEKGWSVLAPIGYTTKVLSKTSEGAKLIAGSKVGLDLFKKLKPVSEFVKTNKLAIEGVAYVGDGLTVVSYAYDEFTNPKSPAYGDASKAVYGGLNVFLQKAGPLEGAQYAGPVGAIAGFINYFGQGGGLSDVPIINKIPFIKDGFNWIDEKHIFITEIDKKKWIEKQYEIYDERKKHLDEGDVVQIKEDWFGQQKGRVNVGDFNTGLPKW
ncbi:LXG domain-containing protein [Listeria seeligeri]|uniref:LXG domain-containing protein n=1 Tax=Listeria seeligeri TaxID=1640 RepID=UPI0021AB71A4|nr:LXG domain-containing protein [Listeria seeligeri]